MKPLTAYTCKLTDEQATALDAALRARLTAAGLTAVRIKYHQGVVMTQLEALYRELAGATPKESVLLS